MLALDVGGTKVIGGLAREDGTLLTRIERSSGGSAGAADPGLAVTLGLAAELVGRAAAAGLTITAIGAGFPEYVRDSRLTSCEVLDWKKQPAELLGALAPGIPVVVESDVRCGALAEYVADRAVDTVDDGPQSLYYLSWGTGLSGTLVLDGRCVYGARGEAIAFGELDNLPAENDEATTNLEAYASGAGMAARYSRSTGREVDRAATVFQAAASGDRQARLVVESAGRAVGAALAWVVALLDPSSVVLGGGIGCGPALSSTAVARSYDQLTSRRPGAPPLRPSRNGKYSGLIGAALFAGRAASTSD